MAQGTQPAQAECLRRLGLLRRHRQEGAAQHLGGVRAEGKAQRQHAADEGAQLELAGGPEQRS